MVFGYIQFFSLNPDIIVDISPYIEQKIESVKAYKSQFYDPGSNEPETVISSKKFLENIKERASDLGRLIGTEFGEGLISVRTPGIADIFQLI